LASLQCESARPGRKQPYYFHPAKGACPSPGWTSYWPDPANDSDDPDRWLWSAAIITHHATWLAGVMNDRTPDPQTHRRLARPGPDRQGRGQKLISGIEYEPLQVRAVSTAGVCCIKRPEAILTGNLTGGTLRGCLPAVPTASRRVGRGALNRVLTVNLPAKITCDRSMQQTRQTLPRAPWPARQGIVSTAGRHTEGVRAVRFAAKITSDRSMQQTRLDNER
jgi:hypothetical protein